MKSVILSIAIVLQAGMASANCLSPKEAKAAYKGCMRFLELPAKEQRRIAASVGATRREGIRQCGLLKRVGLKKVLANERYLCEQSSGRGSSTSDEPICKWADDCKGGYCSASGRCMNGGSGAVCDSSLQCANGYCDLGGRCN